jgi:hypothetical protein
MNAGMQDEVTKIHFSAGEAQPILNFGRNLTIYIYTQICLFLTLFRLKFPPNYLFYVKRGEIDSSRLHQKSHLEISTRSSFSLDEVVPYPQTIND